MRIFLFSIYVAVLFTFCSNPASSNNHVRFDGLYYSSSGDFVRFYQDVGVITVNSTGSPSDVAKWFSKSNQNVGTGTYVISGENISFSSFASGYGSVDYSGKITNSASGLSLHYVSNINGNQGNANYAFYQTALP